MKIYTQFIILHKDIAHPSEDEFCPFIWQSEHFDSDGDYYCEGINGLWNELSLSSNELDSEAQFDLFTYRENPTSLFGYTDQIDLKVQIDHFRNKKFGLLDGLSNDDQLAVTSLSFSTKNLSIYEMFLETVYFFLNYSKGYLVNFHLMNADEFKAEFLD